VGQWVGSTLLPRFGKKKNKKQKTKKIHPLPHDLPVLHVLCTRSPTTYSWPLLN